MRKTIYVKTFGCPLNKFDSLVMKWYLKREGYEIVDSLESSEILVVNTCGVKKQTEDRIIDYLKKINRIFPDKKIIVAGCLPLINFERLSTQIRYNAVLGPSPNNEIIKAVDSVVNGRFYSSLDITYYRIIPEDLPSIYDGFSLPIGVSSGCLDKCSFCGTRFARGVVKSLSLKQIKVIVENAVKQGIKEIYLTSSDLGAYGFDLNPKENMISLLKMIDDVEGEFIVRIGMANPRWIYRWLDELIEIFKTSNKFYFFLHIPVQSGSDKMLKIMRRGHGTLEYLTSVKRLRSEVDKRFSISTDIIVGHPGETDSDFEMTLDLIKESQPDFINISKFFPRPRTLAKEMKQLPTDLIKRRSIFLSHLADEILLKRNRLWIGWRGSILVNEKGKNNTLMGRNYAYKIVVVSNRYSLGDILNVKIVDAKVTWLKAIVSSRSSSFLLSKEFSEQIS